MIVRSGKAEGGRRRRVINALADRTRALEPEGMVLSRTSQVGVGTRGETPMHRGNGPMTLGEEAGHEWKISGTLQQRVHARRTDRTRLQRELNALTGVKTDAEITLCLRVTFLGGLAHFIERLPGSTIHG